MRYDFSPRIDYAIAERNTLTMRYEFEHSDQTNAGVGNLTLPTAGYYTTSRENNIQISDSQVFSAKLINETRFQFSRDQSSQLPNSLAPTVAVIGNFVGGGNAGGTQTSTFDHIEVQNYTSVQLAKNFIRAGMRVRINRQAQFSTAGSNGTFSYRTIADYQNSNPFQYRVTLINNAHVGTHLTDVGLYAEDDWKARPNLTLTYGLRYEAQGAIQSSHDLAPRVSVNYGVPRKGGDPKTVVRLGYGIFYNRFNVGDEINTIVQNGTNELVQNFLAPTAGCGPGNVSPCGANQAAKNTIYTFGPGLRSSYNSQFAAGVDQQLPAKASLSLTYLNTIGLHQYFSRSVANPADTNLLYQYQSGGTFRTNQLLVNVRGQVTPKLSIFGFYSLRFQNSNTNGSNSFQTDPLNPNTDYGRTGNRSSIFAFASWTAPLKLSVSPFMIFNSGTPYSIVTGTDVNNDSQIIDRAAFAPGVANASCGNALAFSTPVNTDSYARVPVGYCTGPTLFTFNTRIVRAFGFGPKLAAAAAAQGGGGGFGGPGGGGRGPGGPGGGRGFGGGGLGNGVSTGRKYTVSVGAQILNLFNNVPYAVQNNNLTAYSSDPARNLFGYSQSLAQGPFSEGSAVRRIFLQANFSF